jgi:hypothetical protein
MDELPGLDHRLPFVTAGRIKKVSVSMARKEGEKQKEEMWRSGAEEMDESLCP